jgi:hypothetical protein
VEPALDSYAHARTWAATMRQEVLEGRMPPWPAAAGLAEYSNDRRMTSIETQLLVAWSDGGAPLGAAAAAAAAVAPPADAAKLTAVRLGRAQNGRLDVTLDLPADLWIAGWEFRPAVSAGLEHIVFFVDGARLGSWVPADGAVQYPSGVGRRIARRARVTAELRVGKSAPGHADAGTLLLRHGAKGLEPRFHQLPCTSTRLDRSVQALAIAPRGAAAGDFMEVVARRPDGSVEPLVGILRFQPGYPASFRFRRPIALPRGTAIDVRAGSPGCSAALEVTGARLAAHAPAR